uniref:Uncharacterized protein n=1 Tax=Peromyscus maniculatus bairdii TaxID=230844 RepID=A0A8C8W8E2_PERMB
MSEWQTATPAVAETPDIELSGKGSADDVQINCISLQDTLQWKSWPPGKDSTRFGCAGTGGGRLWVCPRPVIQTILLLHTGAPEVPPEHPDHIAECFADEVIRASQGSSNSHAVKKHELDRVAKSNCSFPSCCPINCVSSGTTEKKNKKRGGRRGHTCNSSTWV